MSTDWTQTTWPGDPTAGITYKTQYINKNFNNFDELGALMCLERNPGEKNMYFKNRIGDIGLHKPGATNEGLHNAISRELGLKPYYDAITISAGVEVAVGSNLVDRNPYIEVAQTGIFYDSDTLIHEEFIYLDTVYGYIELTYYPRFPEDIIISTTVGEVDTELYTVDGKKIIFTDGTYYGQWLRVKYNYRKFFSFYSTGYTPISIATLQTNITAFVIPNTALPYITFTINDPNVSTINAHFMLKCPPVALTRVGYNFHVYQARVLELYDNDFKALYTNRYGHLYGTRIDGWAKEISRKASITWGDCILDRDQWDIVGKRYLDVLPHLFDNEMTRWFADDPSITTLYKYQYTRYYGGITKDGNNNIQRKGIHDFQLKSGTGHKDDLKLIDIVED